MGRTAPRSSHGVAPPVINSRERVAHFGRCDAAALVCKRTVEEQDHEHARGHHGGDKTDGYRLHQGPLAAIRLRAHIGDRDCSADTQHEPQWGGHQRDRHREATPPAFAALRLQVEPLCVRFLLSCAVGFGNRNFPVQAVDPALHLLARAPLAHRGPFILNYRARVADQPALQMITRRRPEHRSDGMKFADSNGFLVRRLPRTLVALQREDDHERKNDSEHGPDHRQRAGRARRVFEPAALGRASTHKQLDGDCRSDHQYQDEGGDPGAHDPLL